MKTFTKNTAATFIAQIVILIIGIATSIIIARVLGPEGKGLYSLAILLPTLMATLTNFGISPATVYLTASGSYDRKQIFGNNILFSLVIGAISLTIGLVVVLFLKETLLPGLPMPLALVGMFVLPLTLLVENLQKIFIGMQKILTANILSIIYFSLSLVFILIALFGFRSDVLGVLIASILSLLVATIMVVLWLNRTLRGVRFSLNFPYIKSTLSYGLKAHLGNILGFLNLRADVFLVNFFINPTAVGFYSISVNIAEKLWLVSRASSTVLFPKVAAEKNEQKRKEFTPIISRTMFLITVSGALILFFIVEKIIVLLYSPQFLSSVRPLQILLPGIAVGGADSILAHDIAGRGKPLVNSYISIIALIVNIILNISWIPKFGIEGAAWASTISYGLTFVGRVLIYSRISGNSFGVILLPQRSDVTLYKKLWGLTLRKLRGR